MNHCLSYRVVFQGLLALVMLGVLAGCGSNSDAQSLDRFRQKWFDAVNNQDGESLFHLLDAQSQRWVSRELDELRGLNMAAQKRIVDQLGGQRMESLIDVTPPEYFGMLWRQATAGRRPAMKVDAAGAQTAYITISLDDSAPKRIRLTVEGGQWVWQLPESEFSVRAQQQSVRH